MSNAAATAPLHPEWAGDFCRDYTLFLFGAGKWTLIAGVLLGIALAITTIVLLLRKKDGAAEAVRLTNAATATAVLDAIKGFLQALSSAPTWLALFGAGVLLLWLAGSLVPETCKPPPQSPCAQQCPQPNVRAPGTQPPAGTPQRPAGTGNTQ